MHTQSIIITVAVGAAGIANCMPAVGRRSPQLQQDGFSGGNNYGASKYQGGGYQGGGYQGGGQPGGQGGGFPFSILNGLGGGGGQGGGILPFGGGSGGGPGGGLFSSVSNVLPLGGGSGGGLGGLLKREEQKAQNGQDDDDCSEQCEDYCDQYFDGQNNNGGWNQGGFGQNFGQSGFQKRQTIDRIAPGFGPGPAVIPGNVNRPGQYGGGAQQCPIWQQGGYQGGQF
ncbi:hypothetical protein M409DRAFT_50483 [Zasmidium cellare ATCC 36951]|uniref:Uncharacterized protein n=1 Tax=Zasmidium cellare ATCC 36951 TaxID=1080233 RepID=A0A6A6D2J8_ZASCE|nr:uncharacterized protein M409DRAFT_50483 [Zasmidium cellare ATCC 36951]KAF2171856.1 hypothetical protein M409DRAFT_50483 [Zasmidium cellare ATCC 36951]